MWRFLILFSAETAYGGFACGFSNLSSDHMNNENNVESHLKITGKIKDVRQ
jgi:hypothetical protein